MTHLNCNPDDAPDDTPILFIFREWLEHFNFAEGQATLGMDDDALDRISAERHAVEQRMLAQPSRNPIDVLAKLLAFTLNGTEFSEGYSTSSSTFLQEAKTLVDEALKENRMANLETHLSEQDQITAACEAGECEHDECQPKEFDFLLGASVRIYGNVTVEARSLEDAIELVRQDIKNEEPLYWPDVHEADYSTESEWSIVQVDQDNIEVAGLIDLTAVEDPTRVLPKEDVLKQMGREIFFTCPTCGGGVFNDDATAVFDDQLQRWVLSDLDVNDSSTLICGDCGDEHTAKAARREK